VDLIHNALEFVAQIRSKLSFYTAVKIPLHYFEIEEYRDFPKYYPKIFKVSLFFFSFPKTTKF
jgi:hypothetical protein